MAHEVILYGSIEGVEHERLRALNAAALADLPAQDEWPWLVRGMFALPADWPQGTFRSQVIHFGASLKDEPQDRACWDAWIGKFEEVLRRLYWYSATLHLVTEFEPDRVFRWIPTPAAAALLSHEPPQPVQEWERSLIVLSEKAEWTNLGGPAADND